MPGKVLPSSSSESRQHGSCCGVRRGGGARSRQPAAAAPTGGALCCNRVLSKELSCREGIKGGRLMHPAGDEQDALVDSSTAAVGRRLLSWPTHASPHEPLAAADSSAAATSAVASSPGPDALLFKSGLAVADSSAAVRSGRSAASSSPGRPGRSSLQEPMAAADSSAAVGRQSPPLLVKTPSSSRATGRSRRLGSSCLSASCLLHRTAASLHPTRCERAPEW